MGAFEFLKFRDAIAAVALAIVGAVSPTDHAEANTPTATVVEIEQAFDYAMAALNAGQPRIAIPVLQAILADNPKLVRVRLELARAYFMAEQ